jgi:hypothetical protein
VSGEVQDAHYVTKDRKTCVEHVVKWRDREKDGIDKTLRWRLTFPMSMGTPLDLNCATSRNLGSSAQA